MSVILPVKTFSRAADLPDRWDVAAADNLFLRRDSLRILEDHNPCGQRYHFAGSPGMCSIAVTYRHKLNLLTYGKGSLNLPITIVGLPCSVSGSGCSLLPESRDILIRHLHEIPGTKIVLNSEDPSLTGFSKGTTLPTCRLKNEWADLASYLSDMRSHYRNRLKRARIRGAAIQESIVKPENFSSDLYALYENVFNRSRYKLEKLSLGFFREFPADIVQFSVGQRPIAFVQTIFSGDELVFMFAGMDYQVNQQYDTYLNILLYVIGKGIEAGCSSIELGQTAEEIKCKMGGQLTAKHLHIAHSNMIGNWVLQSLTRTLSYRQRRHEYHVFKRVHA